MEKITTENWILKAKEIHGDKYLYDRTSYINAVTKLIITCRHHGDFLMMPGCHIGKKQGCKKCADRGRVTSALKKKWDNFNKISKDIVLPPNSKAIPTSKGEHTIVDEEDFEELSKYNWYNSHGYSRRTTYNYENIDTPILMHRYIMGLPNTDPRVVDHISGDKSDNRKCNLRICTVSDNVVHRRVVETGSKGNKFSSKYKGVSHASGALPWRTEITYRYHKYSLGGFPTEKEAALAYDKAARILHEEFAVLNFPDDDSTKGYVLEKEATSSEYRGVHWHKTQKKYHAVSQYIDGVKKHIGVFTNEIEAAKAVDRVSYELLGDKAILNFPEDFGITPKVKKIEQKKYKLIKKLKL